MEKFSEALHQEREIYNKIKDEQKRKFLNEVEQETIKNFAQLKVNFKNEVLQSNSGNLRYSRIIADKFCKNIYDNKDVSQNDFEFMKAKDTMELNTEERELYFD